MDIQQRAARAQDWLGQAWDVWTEHGVDSARGGFHESLRHEDLTCTSNFRRLRVLTRQIYVFSKAAQYGYPKGEELVNLGLCRLREAQGPDGLYPWRFDLDNRAVDETRDLYDHAFVLLALSSASHVVGAKTTRTEAENLILHLTTQFRHEDIGFIEALPPSLPRRQNPHMHLLEASLAAYRAFRMPEALTLARELCDLFLHTFFQRESGILAEFFNDDLTVQTPIIVEPGHHFEWIWLLHQMMPLSSNKKNPRNASQKLYAFATRHGVCARSHVVRDQVGETGDIVSDTARLWPQTERLKAELCCGTEASIAQADDALASYLAAGRRGLWAERMDERRELSTEAAPASSLYHITCALTELIDFARKN